MNLEVAAALYACGELRREQIPPVAADLLAAGVDGPTVRELAGLAEVELDRAHDLFHRLMLEMGRAIPARGEAAATIARYLAEQAVKPGANLRRIAAEGARLATALEYHDALMPFYTADDSYDMPEICPRAVVDGRLLEYARSIVGGP